MENTYNFDYSNKEDYYLEHIEKGNRHSETNTEKYHVKACQSIVDKKYDTSKWIMLDDMIKSSENLKIFKGLILSKHKIVVKIGYSDTIKKEYDIGHQLSIIPCFITYLCYFNCNNNITTILSNTSVCAKDGDKINVLVMKNYELGDIKNYKWDENNFIMLLSLIKCVIVSFYLAFKKFGFIHNDAHFGNILIKETKKEEIVYENEISIKLYGYEPIIMDFETSLFDKTKSNFEMLYKMFIQIISGIHLYINIITNNIEDINKYLLYHINNNIDIDINQLLYLIDKLEFIRKIDIYKLPKYNPYIF